MVRRNLGDWSHLTFTCAPGGLCCVAQRTTELVDVTRPRRASVDAFYGACTRATATCQESSNKPPSHQPNAPGPSGPLYRQLDDAKIIETLERLRDRIRERFPGSSLSRVSEELLGIARESASHIAYLQRPNWPVRVGVGIAIAAMLGAVFVALTRIRLQGDVGGWPELVQVVESGVNDLVFLGIAVFFLLTIETRVKRRRALRALHELRSIAHVVDMHQLTKDPEQLTSDAPATASSPVRAMTRTELGRYLDYCSELLSVTSKIAALYVERFDDDVTLGAVNEIESLTAGLSRKVWQKISMLNA